VVRTPRCFLRLMTVVLGVTTLAGCQFNHVFRLPDIDQLALGESTKHDLERIFGERDFTIATTYSSWERDRVVPPLPISLISWPLFLQTHEQRFDFSVQVDSRNVVIAGTLQVSEESATTILLLFGPSDYTVHLDEEDIRILREIRKKGFDVEIAEHPLRCFGGIIGWVTVPLEEYLEKRTRP